VFIKLESRYSLCEEFFGVHLGKRFYLDSNKIMFYTETDGSSSIRYGFGLGDF
jgi:hypothetical protein